MDTRPVLATEFRLDPAAAGPQEIVTLRSVSTAGRFEASAVRSWVTDLDGTGLETDVVDPVSILTEPDDGDLAAFHRRALDKLAARRSFDYEVADLFATDPS